MSNRALRVSAIATAALAITAWLAFAVLVASSQVEAKPSHVAFQAADDVPLFDRRNIEEAALYGYTAVRIGDTVQYFTEEEVFGIVR